MSNKTRVIQLVTIYLIISSVVAFTLLSKIGRTDNYILRRKNNIVCCRHRRTTAGAEVMGTLRHNSNSNDNNKDPMILGSCTDSTKKRFRGDNILLTGATGGLGKALAAHFASCCVKTLIVSGRDRAALQKVVDSCKVIREEEKGDMDIYVLPCDLSDLEAVKDLGDEALRLCKGRGSGCVDVLVNNGGISSRSNFLDTKFEVDELLMRVNFLSGSCLAKKVVPSMVQNGSGAILWVSSVQGLVGLPGRTSYAASKFAVQGYCEALRGELASSGVTVHVTSPGYIRTNLSRSAIQGDGSKYGKMDDTTANGADPQDVAVQILDFVANGKSDFLVAAGFSAKAAIWLRLMAPSLLASMLVKKFDKASQSNK